ncbi:preprotein translocase subunit SecE [Candidatus Woesebacteria bacterium]|jgi:preprotein translocase SecE subunit|nr:preprotein translocase subunit SecE [Candidatus Woesebacteria bacterium]HNV45272.1 preprotein translocase subunit SecE [Candidatus Woesebacteria bacterium]HOA12181.1 preprotein translocase subunit SecE [Candidatus Woesebacteria bacterium]HOC07651.1 preprotein translocase subunit SecE [Candidatus Woesebacteria bacterium]HOI05351.1 preprotein translocase subunit SecE [Candidatus Woesebacteria bacterium]
MLQAIKKYLLEVKTELGKTTWPDKKTTKNLSILVVVVSLLLALYIGFFDFILQELIALFV